MIGTLIVIAVTVLVVCLLTRSCRTPSASTAPVPEAANTSVPEQAKPEIPPADVPSGDPETEPVPVADTPAPVAKEGQLERYVENMSVRDKLGQLVMFGFSGTSTLDKEFKAIVEQYHVGNAVLYGSNIHRSDDSGGFNTARKLTNRVESNNPTGIPYLVSIDIEGGVVQRFKWSPAPSSARTLGRKNDYDLAYSQFLRVGKKLKDVGINMNLAPVLDVSEEAMKTVLRTRIISSNAETTAKIGCAIIDGLRDASCLSVAKHFPGHGGTTSDSHSTTPVIRKTAEQMNGYDLIPFRAAVEDGVDTVLVAHISYPELDNEDIASMSSKIITGLLREEMGHDGLVMSDDFRMSGLLSKYNVGDAAVRFILAGGDLILCGPRHDLQTKIMETLTNAAENGTLTEERINESVVRILKKKVKVTGWTPADPVS